VLTSSPLEDKEDEPRDPGFPFDCGREGGREGGKEGSDE